MVEMVLITKDLEVVVALVVPVLLDHLLLMDTVE
jgi:hypothetical protein